MHWEAINAALRKTVGLEDNVRYTDLSGAIKSVLGNLSLTELKYLYKLRHHTPTVFELGLYSVLTSVLIYPGAMFKDKSFEGHQAAMIQGGIPAKKIERFFLVESTMMSGSNRINVRDLYVAVFKEKVKLNVMDFSSIGSPYDTTSEKKRKEGGTSGTASALKILKVASAGAGAGGSAFVKSGAKSEEGAFCVRVRQEGPGEGPWMQQFGRDSIPRSTDEISGGSRFPDG